MIAVRTCGLKGPYGSCVANAVRGDLNRRGDRRGIVWQSGQQGDALA